MVSVRKHFYHFKVFGAGPEASFPPSPGRVIFRAESFLLISGITFAHNIHFAPATLSDLVVWCMDFFSVSLSGVSSPGSLFGLIRSETAQTYRLGFFSPSYRNLRSTNT